MILGSCPCQRVWSGVSWEIPVQRLGFLGSFGFGPCQLVSQRDNHHSCFRYVLSIYEMDFNRFHNASHICDYICPFNVQPACLSNEEATVPNRIPGFKALRQPQRGLGRPELGIGWQCMFWNSSWCIAFPCFLFYFVRKEWASSRVWIVSNQVSRFEKA